MGSALAAALGRSYMFVVELAVFVIGVVVILDEAVFAPDCSHLRCPTAEPCLQIMIGCTPRAMGERLGYAAAGAALILLALFAARFTWRARPQSADVAPT